MKHQSFFSENNVSNSRIFDRLKNQYKNDKTREDMRTKINEWREKDFTFNERDERTNGMMVDSLVNDIYSAISVDKYSFIDEKLFKNDITYLLYKLSVNKDE